MDFEEITGIIPVVSDTNIPFCAPLSMKEYMDLLSKKHLCDQKIDTALYLLVQMDQIFLQVYAFDMSLGIACSAVTA